jgi:hypothetical protein
MEGVPKDQLFIFLSPIFLSERFFVPFCAFLWQFKFFTHSPVVVPARFDLRIFTFFANLNLRAFDSLGRSLCRND